MSLSPQVLAPDRHYPPESRGGVARLWLGSDSLVALGEDSDRGTFAACPGLESFPGADAGRAVPDSGWGALGCGLGPASGWQSSNDLSVNEGVEEVRSRTA